LRYKTDKEKYENKKKDPTFLYNKARKEILRKIKKTGKMPKQSTIDKYQVKDFEIKECMGRKGIIYKITSPSGKVYVGQTIQDFNIRIRDHKKDSSKCSAVKRAIDKYKDQMKYEIIEESVPQEQLDERETFWIKELNSLAPNGYNLTSGGNTNKEYSEELKDKVQNAMNNAKIKKDGYLGSVYKQNNLFKPTVFRDGKKYYLSNGGFMTEEECIEVLKEYTKDPENFTKVEGTFKRNVGSVYKNHNKWAANYNHNHLGSYETEDEAREVLERYLKEPTNCTIIKRSTGSITKQSNRWRLRYKHKYIGSYATEEEAEEARKALV